MKYKRSVYKTLALISQFGINMMVPTFLCLLLGLLVAGFLGTWVVIPFLFLGMAAGMRNCYIMAMNAIADKDTKPVGKKKEESEKERSHDHE